MVSKRDSGKWTQRTTIILLALGNVSIGDLLSRLGRRSLCSHSLANLHHTPTFPTEHPQTARHWTSTGEALVTAPVPFECSPLVCAIVTVVVDRKKAKNEEVKRSRGLSVEQQI